MRAAAAATAAMLLVACCCDAAAAPDPAWRDPPGVGTWTLQSGRGVADSDADPWLLKPRFHLGSPNPAGCAGTGFCAGCNDVNSIFKHRGIWHAFFQHILTPEYNGSKPPAAYRTCWAHSASSDLVKWRARGCVGDWDKTYGVASDGAMLGLDPVTGLPALLFDGLTPGTNFGHNASFVEVFARPKNASDPWLEDWVADAEPSWHSTTTGTNPSPGFALPATSGGEPGVRYALAASHKSGRCSLFASETMRGALRLVNPSFFYPGKDSPHCAQPNLIPLPGREGSAPAYLWKAEGRSSVYTLGEVSNSTKGIEFIPAPGSAAGLRPFDFGNFQWAELMPPTHDGATSKHA